MNGIIEKLIGEYIDSAWLIDAAEAVLVLLVGLTGVTIVRIAVRKTIKREGAVRTAFRRVVFPLLYASAFYLAVKSLQLAPPAERLVDVLAVVLITVLVIRTTVFAISASLRKYVEKTGREDDEKRVKPLLAFVNFVLWIIGAIFLLDNMGFQISTIVAGLGVSGIAIAIAAQGILGDLFNYFVIFFDRPFEIGDFIIFNDKLGVVEKIGIKSTRIRALSGEQLIVSNSDLTAARVHNYKRMMERRVVFSFGVTYQTPAEKLEAIPGIVREIIEARQEARFDRSHFKAYGDFALIFEHVYYVLTADYARYMDIQQEINLAIYREFEERGISFAYPTSRVILTQEAVHRPEGA